MFSRVLTTAASGPCPGAHKSSPHPPIHSFLAPILILFSHTHLAGDRGSTVVKVLYHKSEGRWFDPSWCQWIFHLT